VWYDGAMTKSPTSRSRRKAERPGEILDAAFEEFVKNGYAATRLEDVAARASVTKGTVYFYFETKERVFDEMIRRKSQALFPKLEDHASRLQGTHVNRLRSLVAFVYRTIAEDRNARETLRFLIAEGARFPDLVERHYDEFVHPVIEQFGKVIADGAAAGEFRKSASSIYTEIVMSPALLLSLWSMLFGSRRTLEIEGFTEASLDLLLNGLVADKQPSYRDESAV
jgi:AcrR family transcriptional regulator